MNETDNPGVLVNPFKLIPSSEKAILRPFLASATGARLKRPLDAHERLLAAAGAASPLRGFSAAMLAEAFLEDPVAAAALRNDDPALFNSAHELLAAQPSAPAPAAPAPSAPARRRGPRPRLEADRVAALAPIAMGAVNAVASAASALELPREIEDVEDLIDAAKDVGGALKGGADFVKELRKFIKEWKRRNRGSPGAATGTGDEDDPRAAPEEVPFLVPDEFADLYGEVIDGQMVYSVWLDRVGAIEVDGAGADDVFWVAQSFVHMKQPNRVVVSATLSQEYDLDEFQEARLSPLADVAPGRMRLVAHDDWTVRHAIRDRDAILAIRRGNRTEWIPITKLRHIELFVDLYDSDESELAEDAIAAIITAVIAALAFFKGKVTPSIGSTADLTRANKDALDKLFALINSDELLLEGVFHITPADFEDAFANGTRFAAPDHGAEAAAGRPGQRRVRAYGEDDRVFDTPGADAYNAQNQGELPTRAYWEDKFDSYYEIRLRFERRAQT